MGPSGAGKSTLLHILGLLEDPSDGRYLFLEEPVQKLSEMKRTLLHRDHIGFVFQQYHLIDELTVYENIETPLLYKKLKASERKSRVADVLDRFRSEEHTSELQSLMRISYAVFCLQKINNL